MSIMGTRLGEIVSSALALRMPGEMQSTCHPKPLNRRGIARVERGDVGRVWRNAPAYFPVMTLREITMRCTSFVPS